MSISFYKTLSDSTFERVISRSRFITRVFCIDNQDHATKILKDLKKEYSDATHICYGFVADIEGFVTKSSDDKEPSGTAGQPILEAIKKRGYRKVLVAVIRYYGGIKLGAGGLTRAYFDNASLGMDNSSEETFTLCDIYALQLDFSSASKIAPLLASQYTILKTEYLDCVEMQIGATKESDLKTQISQLTNGKFKLEKIDTQYIKTPQKHL